MDAAGLVSDLVRDGLVSAVLWMIPIAAAGVVAAAATSALLQRVGISDPSVVVVVRAAAVLGTLLAVSAGLGADATDLGRACFDHLAPLGRGELPPG